MFIEKSSERSLSKAEFVYNLGVLLSQTREGVDGCTLLDDDTVLVQYTTGYELEVNIHMDSWMSIIIDVVKAIEL